MEAPGQNGAEPFQMDEKWFAEWFEWGLKSLDRFMGRQAAFLDFLANDPRPPADDDPALD